MPDILKLKNKNLKNLINETIKVIKEGGVIVSPTDTVYGLVCDATNKRAVAKIFKIKKRENKKPLPIFVKNIKMAKELAEINKTQEKFLKKAWPGKKTIILKQKSVRIKIYGIDKKTIALRVPRYRLLLSLAKQLNRPLVGTSANVSGNPASTKIQDVVNQFEGQRYQPDLIIDANNLKASKPSTVIDLTAKKPKILRK